MLTRHVLSLFCVATVTAAAAGYSNPIEPALGSVVSYRNPLQHQLIHSYTCTTDQAGQRGTILLPKPSSESWQRVVTATTAEPATSYVSDVYKQPFWGLVDTPVSGNSLRLTARATLICSDLVIDEERASKIPWSAGLAKGTRLPVRTIDANRLAAIKQRVEEWKRSVPGPYEAMKKAYRLTRSDRTLSDVSSKLDVMFSYADCMGLRVRPVELARLAPLETKTIGEVEVPGLGWVPFDPAAPFWVAPTALTFGSFRSSLWVRLYVGKSHDAGPIKAQFINGHWGNVALGGHIRQSIELLYSQPPATRWVDPVIDNRPIAILLLEFSDLAPPTYTPKQIETLILGSTHPSLANYLETISYGRLSLNGSMVFGPIRMPNPASSYFRAPDVDYDATKNSKLQDDAIATASKTTDLTAYKSVVIVHSNPTAELVANKALIGVQGGGRHITAEGEVVGWGRALVHYPIHAPLGILIHEVGHSFGLDHSWDLEKRGNPLDGMGGETTYNAWHRIQLGVMRPSEIAEVSPGETKEIVLNRLGDPKEVIKAVRIWRSNRREFTLLELRARDNAYDRNLPHTGLFIYEVDPARPGLPSNPGAAPVDRVSALIQHPPGNPYASWPSGATYSTPHVIVTSSAINALQRTIRVTNRDQPAEPKLGD